MTFARVPVSRSRSRGLSRNGARWLTWKVFSKTPEYQPGAAAITLRRYTHTLPGELEWARDLLDAFLVERVREQDKRARQ